ncbi:MAG: AAA family ATPase [Candidatus Omnitrophica bacterium]|nr:AAA family ATPase [Candidatus Omnitrophota bacterium]
MRIVAIANQKGGCGKTTTSINLAACLAQLQKKILLVDLDPQGHSTCGLGIEPEKLSYTLYDLLKLGITQRPVLQDVWQRINSNFFIIPSEVSLSQVEEEYANVTDWQKALKELLSPECLKEHQIDFVIIDCPPNLGVLTYNAFEAADEVIIPVEPSFFSLHGLAKISETLNSANQRRARPLTIHALMTLFDTRNSFSKEVYDDVQGHFKERLFKTIIHESVTLKEAAAVGQSIVEYDSKSSACKNYWNLALEYLERVWKLEMPEQQLGWSNIVKHRLGPKKVVGGILFQAMSPRAHTVEIAGDFNQWVPEELVRRDSGGLWQIVLPMIQGNYRYKFIVDGEWQMDPYQPFQKRNDFGSFDSYLELTHI